MNFVDGFRLFYRSLARELYVRAPPEGAVELVLAGPSGFPDEDVRQLAEALALRELDGFENPRYVKVPADGHVPVAGDVPQIFDLREVDRSVSFARSALERADIVFIRNHRQPRLGGRQLLFDRNHRVTIEASARVFEEIFNLIGYRGRGLEILPRYILNGLRAVAHDFSLFGVENGELTAAREFRLLETLSATWRYHGSRIEPEHIRRWLNQFNGQGREGAISLLKYINAAGYYSTEEITGCLLNLLRSEPTGAQLISIQRPGKSEQKLLYEMRVADRTSSLQEALNGPARRLVCVDDVIGSGDTVLECLFGTEKSASGTGFHDWIAVPSRSLAVLAVVASADGIRRIEGDARCFGRVKVRADKIIDAGYGVFTASDRIFENAGVAAMFREVCEKFGEILFPGHPLGWGQCAWGVVAEYNVPDCSLPVIWSDDANLPWVALFSRR